MIKLLSSNDYYVVKVNYDSHVAHFKFRVILNCFYNNNDINAVIMYS